ncbi:hypothetical protein Tco_1185877 [Tanacetum coccineum]
MRKKSTTLGFSLLKEFILLFSRNYLIGALKLSKSPKFLKARWRFFLALTKRTSESWMFHVSTSIPLDKLKYGYIKNHIKTVKNGQTRARESEEHKRAKDSKPKPEKVNLQSTLGQQKSTH